MITYKIELSEYHSRLLKHISEYAEIDVNELIRRLVITHIETFDKDMQEFLEQSLSLTYDEYDGYSGRYID